MAQPTRRPHASGGSFGYHNVDSHRRASAGPALLNATSFSCDQRGAPSRSMSRIPLLTPDGPPRTGSVPEVENGAYCPRCGAGDAQGRFCARCGTSLGDVAAAQESTPVPPGLPTGTVSVSATGVGRGTAPLAVWFIVGVFILLIVGGGLGALAVAKGGRLPWDHTMNDTDWDSVYQIARRDSLGCTDLYGQSGLGPRAWTLTEGASPPVCTASSAIGEATAFTAQVRLISSAEARAELLRPGQDFPTVALRQVLDSGAKAWDNSAWTDWSPGQVKEYSRSINNGRYILHVVISAGDLSDARNGDFMFASETPDDISRTLDMLQSDRTRLGM